MREKIVIEGGHKLNGTVEISGAKNATVALIPAIILADSPVTIYGVPEISDVDALAVLLEELNCTVLRSHDSLIVDPSRMENVGDSIIVYGDNKNFNAVDVRTQVYPGFATDLQQPLTALLTQANGQSQVIETIYPERFRHCEQLNKMGANIELDESMCYINGKTPLKGAKVEATDLRCGAALLIAGLIADGITEISNVYHIDRGYANIDQKLITLGAVIHRQKNDS